MSNSRPFAVKIDQLGDTLWFRDYADFGGRICGMDNSLDGGLVLVGKIDGASVIIKTDENGLEQWQTPYYSNEANYNGVTHAADGGYVAVGFHSEDPFDDTDSGHIVKYDESGSLEWETLVTIEGIKLYFTEVAQLANGNFIVFAEQRIKTPEGTIEKIFVHAFNQVGDELWSKLVYDSGEWWHQAPYTRALWSHEEDFILGLYKNSSSQDSYMARFDANGNLVWEKMFDYFPGENLPVDDPWICPLPNGNIGFAGHVVSVLDQLWLASFDIDDGSLLWLKMTESPVASWKLLRGVTHTLEGGMYLVANSRLFGSDIDEVFVMKVDEMGEVTADIEATEEEFEVSVYPNPSSEFINLKISNDNDANFEVYVFDLNGKLVFIKNINTSEAVLIDALPKGVYEIILVENCKAATYAKKIIIE